MEAQTTFNIDDEIIALATRALDAMTPPMTVPSQRQKFVTVFFHAFVTAFKDAKHREHVRIVAITRDIEAFGRADAAEGLAHGTDMEFQDAIEVLASMPRAETINGIIGDARGLDHGLTWREVVAGRNPVGRA